MKNYKYIGTFVSTEGHKYQLTVRCHGFLQAFFLLTAAAIKSGRHYQLDNIVDEKGNIAKIDDIVKCNELIKVK